MSEKILVTAKTNPDLDGTACALAYAFLLKQTGKNAEALIFGELQPETLFFVKNFDIDVPAKPDDGIGDWDNFILVDASSMAGMPKIIQKEKVAEVIDHRELTGENEFPKAVIQNELVGAAATLVFERIEKKGVKLPKELALLIYGAIFHNTSNLLSFNTTQRDKDAAAALENAYGFSRNIINNMFRFVTDESLKNLAKVINLDSKQFQFGSTKIFSSQLIIFEVENNLKNLEGQLTDILENQKEKTKANIAFINIFDLSQKKNVLFCPGVEGQNLISKAIGVQFSGNWTESSISSPMLLRKQIMPKIKAVIESHGQARGPI